MKMDGWASKPRQHDHHVVPPMCIFVDTLGLLSTSCPVIAGHEPEEMPSAVMCGFIAMVCNESRRVTCGGQQDKNTV